MATPWVEESKTGCTSISGTTVKLFTYPELVYNKHAYTAKNYLVKMTVSAWLLQFQGSLNQWVVWLKKF